MPSAREGLRGQMDYWRDLNPRDRRNYQAPERSRTQRALEFGLKAAAVGAAGVAAYRSGLLRPAIQRAVQTITRADFGPADQFTRRLAQAGHTLQDQAIPWWRRPIDAASAIGSAASAPRARDRRARPSQIERIIAERNHTLAQHGRWGRETTGTIDVRQQQQMRTTMDDEIIRRQMRYDPQQEQRLLQQTGYRHMTVQEALDRKVISDQEALRELSRRAQREYGESFAETHIADSLLLIGDTGQIQDLRPIHDRMRRSWQVLERQFGIPFVGFNPLQLFHSSKLLGFEPKRTFTFFDPRGAQPNITGNIEALGRPMFFSAGGAYDFAETGVRRLAEGTAYSGAYGTPAHAMRVLSNMPITQFGQPDLLDPWHKKFGYKLGEFLHLGRQDYRPSEARLDGLGRVAFSPDDVMGSAVWKAFDVMGVRPPTVRMNAKQIFEPSSHIFLRGHRPYSETANLGEFMRQFYADRNRLDELTTGALFPFHYFNRLNNAISRVGLGLPSSDMSSTGAAFGNILKYRALPIVGGIFGWRYLNYEMDNFFGTRPSEWVADGVTHFHTGIADIRDELGVTEWFDHAQHVAPGFEELQALPVVGPFLELGRSAEETYEYYTEGLEPIRQGRYWPAGNTPLVGGRVDRYVPTLTSQMRSQAMFTDNWLGSEDEYFVHAMFPTPRYPLAPLNRYLLNPYWHEKRTYHDRPFPLTGGHPEIEEFPLLGPIFGATIGQIVKPTRRMHPEFWEAYEAGEEYGEAAPILFGPAAQGHTSLPALAHHVNAESTPGIIPVDPFEAYDTGKAQSSFVAPAVPATGFRVGTDGVPEPIPMTHDTGPMQVAYITPSGQVQPMLYTERASSDLMSEGLQGITSPSQAGLQGFPRSDFTLEKDVPLQANVGAEMLYNFNVMGGFYGFSLRSTVGDHHWEPRMATSSAIASGTRHFWNWEIGRAGAQANEIGRRFIPRREFHEHYNPIRNTMPDWLPGDDYFTNFRTGDPYSQAVRRQGELRLPGAAFEAAHNVPEVEALMSIPEIAAMVEAGEVNRFELYSPITRLQILADTAPWSNQYRELSSMISEMPLTDEDRERVREIREMARTRREPIRLYPYRFRHANIEKERVTIQRVIDANTFMTREYPDNPIRLAGVRLPTGQDDPAADEAREFMGQFVRPGAQVTIGYTADELNRVSSDTYHTIRSVVYAGDTNINRELIRAGLGTEQERDFSPAAVHARFSEREIATGALWERFAHMPSPLHTKFLQVRSPLESYERRDLFGKDFQRWNQPWSDFIVPTYESFIARSPAPGIAAAAGLGYMAGRTPYARLLGAGIAGGTVAIGQAYRHAFERFTGNTWIPSRRRTEWETQEYLDVLKYVRAQRQFNDLAEEAQRREGVNVHRLLEQERHLGHSRQRRVASLEELKRTIYSAPNELTEEHLQSMLRAAGVPNEEVSTVREAVRAINARIKETDSREAYPIGPRTAAALQAHQDMQYTMYGYDGGSMAGAIAALPKNIRKYFTGFLNAPPEERERIQEVAPPYMLRMLNYLWGEGLEERVPLEEYFQDRALPGPEWAGWDPDVPWDAVRVRVIRAAGLDEGDMDVWDRDRDIAEAYPVPVPKMELDYTESAPEIRRRLQDVLGAHGYRNYRIDIEPGGQGLQVSANLHHDRRREVETMLQEYLPKLF